MLKYRSMPRFFAIATFVLTVIVPAFALNTRSFVSTTGNDANNCSATAPCRTFGAALAVTTSGGELVVLDSGGYGFATISQSVIITAIGVDASITGEASGQGLLINTTGNVTLIGLNLHGEGASPIGLVVESVSSLRLFNMLFENFTCCGILFAQAGNLEVYDSTFNDNPNAGLIVNSPDSNAYVEGSFFDHNGIGVKLGFGMATVADSSAEYNSTAFSVTAGTLTLFNDRAISNGVGLASGPGNGSVLNFADCLIAGNTTAYAIASDTTMASTSPGTSFIAPGQATSGTLSTANTLQ